MQLFLNLFKHLSVADGLIVMRDSVGSSVGATVRLSML
jgi:hypothetical protein